MKGRLNKTVAIHHGTATRAATGGYTVVHSVSADITTYGTLVPARGAAEVMAGGQVLPYEMTLYLPASTDIRPRKGSLGAGKDKVVIGSDIYKCLWAEDRDGFGGFVRAFLVPFSFGG